MDVEEVTIEETAEPMDDDANDMEFEISSECASAVEAMDEDHSTTPEAMDEDDVEMENAADEIESADEEAMDEDDSTTPEAMDEDDVEMENAADEVESADEDDVEMGNTDDEIESLTSMLRGMVLNEEDITADIIQTMRDTSLHEHDDTTKEITNMMATMELNGKRKTVTPEEEQDDSEIPSRASKRGGFWCGPPPRFNIGMAPPKELRCSRRRRCHSRR